MNRYTAYPHLKNKTVSWLPMDTNELFLKHQRNKHTRKKLKELNWTEDSIEYKFNSQGFRSDNFDSKGDSIVFLGCSHTIGIGINFEDTASYIVSRQLGYNCFNLGLGGGSNDTCFRFAYHWIEKLSPKIVVLIAPSIYRFEIADDRRSYKNGFEILKASSPILKEYRLFYRQWIDNDDNSYFNFHKNVLAINKICDMNGAKFVCTDFDQVDPRTFSDSDNFARDLAHAGRLPNREKANEILNLIGELLI
jgi:hypothetical protein